MQAIELHRGCAGRQPVAVDLKFMLSRTCVLTLPSEESDAGNGCLRSHRILDDARPGSGDVSPIRLDILKRSVTGDPQRRGARFNQQADCVTVPDVGIAYARIQNTPCRSIKALETVALELPRELQPEIKNIPWLPVREAGAIMDFTFAPPVSLKPP